MTTKPLRGTFGNQQIQKFSETTMAYKTLSDAMSGKLPAPAPAKPKPVTDAQYSGKGTAQSAGPKSSVGARDAYARAMNSGDRKGAARYKAQMDAEEAAANVASKLQKPK